MIKRLFVELVLYFSGVLAMYSQYTKDIWLIITAVVLITIGCTYFHKWFDIKNE